MDKAVFGPEPDLMHLSSRKTSRSAVICALCCLSVVTLPVAAATGLTVRIVDSEGAPVENVIVSVSPLDAASVSEPSRPAGHAVMDQKDNQFVPHILVVRTGTEVEFPNNDTVSHHVYSFSKPKPFQLPLYKGDAHDPVTFDEPGLVVIACNIHDNMLGYILVLDTPFFQATDSQGVARLEGLGAGTHEVGVWTPRMKAGDLPEPARITIEDDRTGTLSVRLDGRLRPPHANGGNALVWSHY